MFLVQQCAGGQVRDVFTVLVSLKDVSTDMKICVIHPTVVLTSQLIGGGDICFINIWREEEFHREGPTCTNINAWTDQLHRLSCEHCLCLCCFSLSAKMESLTLKDSKQEEEEEQKETFVAFARVYSGTVKKGQRVFVLGPKYDPAHGLRMVNQHLHNTCSPLLCVCVMHRSGIKLQLLTIEILGWICLV